MYNTFSADYDRFVNWPSRLSFELPFIEAQLQAASARRVLDAATGTGMHVIALSQRGYVASGADLSQAMIERARENAAQAKADVRFKKAGFGELAVAFGADLPFDALLCLGNSLPHLLTADDLANALLDFAACLRPGGLLLIQNRNFDAVMESRERWMPPQTHQAGENEWIFLRFYDYLAGGLIQFNIVTLQREAGQDWRQSIASTQLYPQKRAELEQAVRTAGFADVQAYGSLSGEPFDLLVSGNLVLGARKAAS
jgi:SAM-dependent methyltransferase